MTEIDKIQTALDNLDRQDLNNLALLHDIAAVMVITKMVTLEEMTTQIAESLAFVMDKRKKVHDAMGNKPAGVVQ